MKSVSAYHALWRFIDTLIRSGKIDLTADEAEWFYCCQPPELWAEVEQ
jgi:hypothetical protein